VRARGAWILLLGSGVYSASDREMDARALELETCDENDQKQLGENWRVDGRAETGGTPQRLLTSRKL
jgi:hypothetical protein